MSLSARLLRLACRRSWVEEYLVEAAAVANGASVSDVEVGKMAHRLDAILTDAVVDSQRELEQFVPGLMLRGDTRKQHERVFQNLSGGALNELIASKRLGSPQHYRYYFAFSQPAGALSDERVQLFISTAETDPVKAIEIFTGLHGETRPQGGTLADVLVDRLIAWTETISEKAVLGILMVFAHTLDDVVRSDVPADFGEYFCGTAMAALLTRISGNARSECVRDPFVNGKALGWLTEVLRSEIFTHGHYGDRQKPPEQRLLTPTEFKSALSAMLTRYRQASANELLGVPDLLSLLFAWFQGSGNTDEPRHWVDHQISTDAGLLGFLPRVRSWRARQGFLIHAHERDRLPSNF